MTQSTLNNSSETVNGAEEHSDGDYERMVASIQATATPEQVAHAKADLENAINSIVHATVIAGAASFAIPGKTLDQVRRDLEQALARGFFELGKEVMTGVKEAIAAKESP